MKKVRKIALWSLVVLLLAGGAGAYYVYQMVYGSNVKGEDQYLYIPTGSTFEDVLARIREKNFLADINSFEKVARKKNYSKKIHPGRYKIKKGMSNDALVNLLRSGQQEPVDITFNSIRWPEQLVSRIGGKLEADSVKLLGYLEDSDFLEKKYGLDTDRVLTMFIPNTYKFNWNTSAEEFLDRMAEEYKKFWSDKRKKKAEKLGLSQSEVAILASIVQEEQQQFADERPVIAGLYINRLKKDHPLESDPTLMYAHKDFSIRRVLNKHKEIESPYNTYLNKGLPPGPLNIPDISSIDAVLDYSPSDYFFMCAKDDFSGRHNFAVTYDDHKKNARKYQAALDKKGIK